MAEKIKISDLFDFSDVQDLQELYRRLEQINQIYKELAKNISQESQTINKGIEANVKEVKKLSDALKVAGDSADIKKLSDQIERQAEINKKLTAQNEKLVSTNIKLKTSQKEVNDQGKEAERLLKEQSRLKAKISQATGEEAKQNAILKLELQRVNKETKEQAKQAAGLENAYQKLVRETRQAKNEAKRLGAALGSTNPEFIKARDNAAKLDKKLKDLDASVGDFQRNVGNYQSALDGITQGFSGVLELATPVGAAIAAVGLVIEGIGALAETVQETNTQLKETAQLTGLNGDQLTDYTSKLRATAKTFDQDYKEVLKATNAITKEFGITGEEALDLINSGFIQGANINDDYLDQLREYSTQFKAAGLEAENLIQITALGAKEGIFNDKAVDTVKEGGLRLREFTKATSDALIPLGKLRNEQIKQAIDAGKSFEAIQLVSQGLKEVNLTAQQSQGIITNVFGGPGEDAGLRFIQLLSEIDTNQQTINANLTEQQKKQLQILKVEEELSNAEVRLGEAFKSSGQNLSIFFKQIQTLGIEGIVNAVDNIKESFSGLAEPISEVKQVFAELADALGLSGDFFDGLAGKITPFGADVKVLSFLLKILLNAIKSLVQVATVVIEFTRLGDVFSFVINQAKNLILFLSNLSDGVLKLIDPLLRLKDAIFAAFGETLGAVLDKIKEFGSTFTSSFDGASNALIDFVNNSSTLQFVIDAFNKVSDTVLSFLSLFTDKLPNTINGTIALINEFTNLVKEEFKNTFGNIADLISAAFTLDVDGVRASLAKLGNTFTDGGERLGQAFKKGFDAEIKTGVADEKQVKQQIEKVNKEVIKTQKEAAVVSTDEKKKELNNKLKVIEDANKKEKLLATENRNNDLISEQEYQDQLLILELERLEKLKEAQEKAGLSTIETEQQIQNILLEEKKKGEKEGIEQEKAAAAESERIKKEKAKKDLEIEKKAQEDRAALASDPIVQAGFDAIEGKIKNELVAAGVSAFRSSLENGDDLQTALANGTKAVAAGQVFKSLSGFHDGGYTGDGYEYGVAGVVHKGEHVITKEQTNKYGLKGLTANDFDKAIETGYFNQFADINNATADKLNANTNIIVNNDNKEVVNKLDQLINNLPKEQLKEVGGVIQHIEKRGQINRITNYPLNKRTVR